MRVSRMGFFVPVFLLAVVVSVPVHSQGSGDPSHMRASFRGTHVVLKWGRAGVRCVVGELVQGHVDGVERRRGVPSHGDGGRA